MHKQSIQEPCQKHTADDALFASITAQLLQNSYQTPTTIIQRSINEAYSKHHDTFPFPREIPKNSLNPDFSPIPHPFNKFPHLPRLPHRPFFGSECDECPHLAFPLIITKYTPHITSPTIPPYQPANMYTPQPTPPTSLPSLPKLCENVCHATPMWPLVFGK